MASGVAGLVVAQTTSGRLVHYDLLGYIVGAAMLVTIGLMYSIQKIAKARAAKPVTPAVAVPQPLPGEGAA